MWPQNALSTELQVTHQSQDLVCKVNYLPSHITVLVRPSWKWRPSETPPMILLSVENILPPHQ